MLALVNKIKRWKVQALATYLSNPFLNNFLEGKIYKGQGKAICLPGLNCYSCPAAIGSCPIGALQSVLGSSKFNMSFYVLGLMSLFGGIFGRFICGFLCPMGWFQELIYKIPSRKLNSKKIKFLKYIKYFLLIFLVVLFPLVLVNEVGMGDPFFCKYICPVGIVEGGIPLAIVHNSIRASLGFLFTWKVFILMAVLTTSVFFYRSFCKWLCPLGAFYSLFNKRSLLRYQLNEDKCTQCGLCVKTCDMNVEVYKSPNDLECIRCGQCMNSCPQKAITHVKILN